MRRINNKQDLANRITESVLKEMGLKHSSRRRALKENREQEILDKVHSMRSNIFDLTEEGYGVLYIDYDPQTNELYAGGATNAGIIKEYSVDYDDSKSLDYNLEGLYDEILQSPPTDDTMAENKNRIRKIVSEALRKKLNEIGDTNRGQYMLGRLAGRKYANNQNEKGYDESGKIAKYAQQQKQYKSVYNPYTSGYDNGFEGNDGQEGYDYYKEMDENKNRIRKFVAESLKKHLREDEERYMSDEDIASQYDGMKITYFEMKPCRYSEGWEGTFELEFPNADEIDYDSTMVNDFITYDKEGSRIGWDYWLPDAQFEQLANIIRKEIAKRSSQTR